MIPISAASSEREAQLVQMLQEAEVEGVTALLAEAKTEEQLVTVAEKAAGFAEATTKKYLHPESPPVACKPGCSWCCYQLVPVSVPETLRISKFLQGLPSSESTGVVERLRSLDKATRGLTSLQRVSIPKACAFLQDGQCSIHPVRPLACAEFTSYDVQVCKRGKRIGFKPDSVMHEKARMLAYNAIQRGLSKGLKAALPQADCEPLELTTASVIAFDTPNAAAAWLEGSNVFKPAHLRHGKK